MKRIWDEKAKFLAMLKVELAVLKSWVKEGTIKEEEYLEVKNSAKVNIKRIKEIEKSTKHDVIAFTRAISETIPYESKKWVHYGLTSTDVVDTANAILIKQANKVILSDLDELLSTLKEKAYLYKNTYCIGRTHGIHAEITTFGLKFAMWYDELKRRKEMLKLAMKNIEVGKISGAVGNMSNVPPIIQSETCKILHLKEANISTQVMPREIYASYINEIALIATLIEKIALEIRSLQRTEVNEVSEFFDINQKGSSAMPHKQNPISSENVSGLARVIRGYTIPAMEDILLWHERDISHSSVERIIVPDATTLIDYILVRYNKVLKTLIVRDKVMLDNIYLTNEAIFSGRVLNALINKGLSREKAYDLIQPLALSTYNNKISFKKQVTNHEEIKTILNKEEIDTCFTLEYYASNINYIYNKVFKE